MRKNTLTTPLDRLSVDGVLSVIAFHEKAGRSQVGSVVFSLDKVFSPAEWPLSPCFHPHSQGAILFARCTLGVLVPAGAAICLSPCGSARLEWNPGQAVHLRLALPRIPPSRLQSQIATHVAALAKAMRIFQRQHISQRDQCDDLN
jgi:hypothetical protein